LISDNSFIVQIHNVTSTLQILNRPNIANAYWKLDPESEPSSTLKKQTLDPESEFATEIK